MAQELVFVLNSENETELPEKLPIEVKVMYAVCMIMKLGLTGLVQDVPDEHGDFFDDMCWIGESDIICVIDAPSLAPSQ